MFHFPLVFDILIYIIHIVIGRLEKEMEFVKLMEENNCSYIFLDGNWTAEPPPNCVLFFYL